MTCSWTSIVVVYLLQMTCPRIEFIYHPYGYIEEVCVLQHRIPPIYHTITSSKCAQLGHSLICLRLSSVVAYEQYTAYPRLGLIYCPNRYREEICRLQFASTRLKCTIQALNETKIVHQFWPKLSITVIVRSLIMKKGTKIDMSSI